MDEQQQQVQVRATDRLASRGYQPPGPAPLPKGLTGRQQLLIEYQVFGCPHAWVSRLTRPVPEADAAGKIVTVNKPVQPGEPLTLIEAADLLRIRRRYARRLSSTPLYQRTYSIEVQRLRDGEKAASIHAMIDIRNDHGAGKAADKTVRLKAAQALIGEGDGNRGPSVQVNLGVVVERAGLVLRLPPDAPKTPLELEQDQPAEPGR
jgi:hypothetical protein